MLCKIFTATPYCTTTGSSSRRVHIYTWLYNTTQWQLCFVRLHIVRRARAVVECIFGSSPSNFPVARSLFNIPSMTSSLMVMVMVMVMMMAMRIKTIEQPIIHQWHPLWRGGGWWLWGLWWCPRPPPWQHSLHSSLICLCSSLSITVLHAVILIGVIDFLAKSKISTCDAQSLQSRVLLYHSQSKYP